MKSVSLFFITAAGLLSTVIHASTINLNFTPEANAGDILPDAAYGLIPVLGAKWNQVTESQHQVNDYENNTFSTPAALIDGSGLLSSATVAINTYGFTNYSGFDAYDALLRSSVRDNYGDTYPGSPRIRIDHIPYEKYDLFIYLTNNSADYPKNGPLGFDFGTESANFKLPADGNYYYMDGIETKTSTVQGIAWGDKATQQLTLGQNCIRIPNCSTEFFVMKGYRTYGRRANICAMQIVERKTITLTGDATISASDYAGTSLEIINTGSTLSTLTIEGALNCASFICSGESFTLKIDNPITAAYAEINTPLTFDISPCAATLAATLTTIQTTPILTAPTAKQAAISMAPTSLIDAHATISSTGITALIRRSIPFAGANAISVNLGAVNDWGALPGNTGKTGNVGLYPVDATRWVNISMTGNTGGYPTTVITEEVTDSAGAAIPGMTIKACGADGDNPTFYNGANVTLTERLFYRYINDNNSNAQSPGTNYCGFAVTGIPYEKYAVIVYYNTNLTGDNIFAAPQINGTCYMGDATLGFTTAVSSPANYWGKADPTQILEGRNTLVVTGFSNTDFPDLILYTPSKIAGAKRTTISAFQIIEMPEVTVSINHTATLSGGDIVFSQIPWDNPADLGPNDTVTLTLLADTNLTLDQSNLILSKFAVKGPAKLRLLPGGDSPTIGEWYFTGLDTLEINGDIPTYTPAPIAQYPAITLYTTATTQTITTLPNQTIEVRAGTSESPAHYTVNYGGGTIRFPEGHYLYTAPGTDIHTTLEIGPDASLDHGTGKFAINHMDALITGGTIKAEYLLAPQGSSNNSPGNITQTAGDIILTNPGNNIDKGQTIVLGNNTGSPTRYTISGGSITAPGFLRLAYSSPVYLGIEGGRVQVEGIMGNPTQTKSLLLAGGELSLGSNGVSVISNAYMTVAGGELTAHATAAISSPFNAAPKTTSTLSAATGEALDFKAPILGNGEITIGNPAKSRNGTVAFNTTEPAGPVTVASGTLLLNGSGATEARFTPTNHRYIRFTITDWPKTNPNGDLTNVNSGLVIAEIILKSDGQTVPWAAGRTATSVPTPLAANWTDALYDLSYSHAYYCTATPTDGKIVITIDRNATSTFDSYQILAGVNNGRNPTAWILEGTSDKDNGPWVLIDSQNLALSDIVSWTSAGGTATAIGPNQARTFPQAPSTAMPLTVLAGSTLGGTGTTAHSIAFEAGSTLINTGTPEEALTALGAITLPESGKISVPTPTESSPNTKHYLLLGEATQTLDLTRFAPADNYGIGRDTSGIFIRRRDGLIITLY